MTAHAATNQGPASVAHETASVSNARVSVLEFFASELVPVGPNMSNMSTPPQNTDFDDQ
jgi:hypothetical protein